MSQQNSRRVRWAFHKADKDNKEADAITNEWIDQANPDKKNNGSRGESPQFVVVQTVPLRAHC